MRETNIARLIKFSPDSFWYADKHTSLCLYGTDYYCFRKIQNPKAFDNKIHREMTENLKDFKCKDCPYSKVWQEAHPAENIPFTCKRKTDTIVIPKSRKPLNAIGREMGTSEIDFVRCGVHYWDSHYAFTGVRSKPEKSNEVWFADNKMLDIEVIVGTNPDGSYKTAKPWITGMLDSATNALVGYCITTEPNTQSIVEAFTRAAVYTVGSDFAGLPKTLVVDNGKDYRSKKMQGSADGSLPLNNDFADQGMLEWLGVEVHHTLPYKGRSKTIERIWRTIDDQFITDLPGYCGSNPSERPASLNDDIKNGNVFSLQQFCDYFNDVIFPGYNNFKADPKKKSPAELYAEIPKARTLVPTWKSMCPLMYKIEDRVLQQSGIKYDNRWYWHPRLARLSVGTSVKVMTFDAPFNRTIGVIKDREFIAEAHLVKELDLVEGKRYKVFQHMEQQAKQRQQVKARITELRHIIFKSDIYEVGTKLPVIEKLSYVPEIDTERDKKATDDPRMPEELKEVTQKYYNSRDMLVEKKEETPMDLILRDIGSNLVKERTMI